MHSSLRSSCIMLHECTEKLPFILNGTTKHIDNFICYIICMFIQKYTFSVINNNPWFWNRIVFYVAKEFLEEFFLSLSFSLLQSSSVNSLQLRKKKQRK